MAKDGEGKSLPRPEAVSALRCCGMCPYLASCRSVGELLSGRIHVGLDFTQAEGAIVDPEIVNGAEEGVLPVAGAADAHRRGRTRAGCESADSLSEASIHVKIRSRAPRDDGDVRPRPNRRSVSELLDAVRLFQS